MINKQPTQHQLQSLWSFVTDFVEEHELHEDNVYDIDKWDCNSIPFIDSLLSFVGCYEYGEEV